MEEKTFTLTEGETRTVLAVFNELTRMKYSELNKFLGSVTIEDMLVDFYDGEILGMKWDEELGWYYPDDFEF